MNEVNQACFDGEYAVSCHLFPSLVTAVILNDHDGHDYRCSVADFKITHVRAKL